MTNNEIERTKQALDETMRDLRGAMAYRPDLRDHDLIAFYHQHIAKLEKMIAEAQS
jgi:hypothetical protein